VNCRENVKSSLETFSYGHIHKHMTKMVVKNSVRRRKSYA